MKNYLIIAGIALGVIVIDRMVGLSNYAQSAAKKASGAY